MGRRVEVYERMRKYLLGVEGLMSLVGERLPWELRRRWDRMYSSCVDRVMCKLTEENADVVEEQELERVLELVGMLEGVVRFREPLSLDSLALWGEKRMRWYEEHGPSLWKLFRQKRRGKKQADGEVSLTEGTRASYEWE